MPTDYTGHLGLRETPQSEPIPGSTQVPNSAGGHAWAVDDWTRLHRFLILGSEGGSYYASERKLSKDNAESVLRCLKDDPLRVVAEAVTISEAGRAPKNDPALFVLALASAVRREDVQQAIVEALPRVARIGTHLFTFMGYARALRGFGRGLKRAVAAWYRRRDAEWLSYQLCKYRSRNGWSHRDVLRLAHVRPRNEVERALYGFAVRGEAESGLPADFLRLQGATSAKAAVASLGGNHSLSWEMVPSEHLGDAAVWTELLPRLPINALIRNLGRMGANGTLTPMAAAEKVVVERLGNAEHIRKSRVHPIAVLSALMVYRQGHGARGNLSWSPCPAVIDALDGAFYAAFGNVEPAGKRTMLALDVSASMDWNEIASVPCLTPRLGSAAMALVTARTEPQYLVTGFSHQLVQVPLTARSTLGEAVETLSRVPMGGTDCSLPMLQASADGLEVDTFVIYTDNETWAGRMHPSQALRQYRDKTGIPAKLVVVGMVSNGFTIADPDDAGMMDVVGFDTATPGLISGFSRE